DLSAAIGLADWQPAPGRDGHGLGYAVARADPARPVHARTAPAHDCLLLHSELFPVYRPAGQLHHYCPPAAPAPYRRHPGSDPAAGLPAGAGLDIPAPHVDQHYLRTVLRIRRAAVHSPAHPLAHLALATGAAEYGAVHA